MNTKIKQRSDYTFKYNQKLGRHGWLRLTPAYSVKLVSEIIKTIPKDSFILDPFSGTATTGLVGAEQGLLAHCLDINPFLRWLGNAKCRNYSQSELKQLKIRIKPVLNECKFLINQDCFLETAKEAGEIDWQAIGGTWGIATSRLQNWESKDIELSDSLNQIVCQIGESDHKNARLMAKYVYKYFYDMHLHFKNLRHNLQNGAVLSYIVGNSSFYGIQVKTEKLLAESLKQLGYINIGSNVVRKRNSKKELFEYHVYATWKQ